MSMKKYTVLVLCLTVFWLFADQNLMAPNLSAIAKDFGFSDQERDEKLGGFIAIGFFIIGGPAALIIGYLTDVCNRCVLFALVVFLGESFCLGTYCVQNYPQLLACRVMTGVSIGGATPIIFSLLGDLFPESKRVYVSTLIGIAMNAGIAAGQLIAGVTGPPYGWRVSFLIVSIPAILCGALVGLTVKEPVRGGQEKEVRSLRQQLHQHYGSVSSTSSSFKRTTAAEAQFQPPGGSGGVTFIADFGSASSSGSTRSMQGSTTKPAQESAPVADAEAGEIASVSSTSSTAAIHVDYSERIEWSKLLKLLRTPSVMLIFLQGLPGCLPWGIVYVFLNDYFSSDLGLTVGAATGALTCFGVGGVVGQLGGGWLGQKLYDRDARWQCVLMGSTTMMSVFPMIYLLNSGHSAGGGFFYFMAWFAGFLVSINGPNARAVLQNVCSPEVRGCAFAVFMLTDDIGKGLGPDCWNKIGIRAAFSVVTLAWLLCGAMLLLLIFFVVSDEQAVQARIRESLLAQSNVLTVDHGVGGEGESSSASASQKLYRDSGGGGVGGGGGGAAHKGIGLLEPLDTSRSGVQGRISRPSPVHFFHQGSGYQSMPQLEESMSSQDTTRNPLHHRLIPFPATTLHKTADSFRPPRVHKDRPVATESPVQIDAKADTKNETDAMVDA